MKDDFICTVEKVKNNSELAAFYDSWFERGYMNEWPQDKKERVLNLIKGLNLPVEGEALDFGCGNGEFTGVLKKALPKWQIYGVDISKVAINNAQNRYPFCSFFLTSNIKFNNKSFDFLLTHHVLEHVNDIDGLWVEINRFIKRRALVLHILPCGNQGSFEYNLCMLKKNGIERNSGNRFYFEDKSHLRRLTSEEFEETAAKHGFCLVNDFYSNQLFGAIDWISLENPSLILQITDIKNAKNKSSALKLVLLRILLFAIKLARFPSNAIDFRNNKVKSTNYYFVFLLCLVFYPLSKLVNVFLKYKINWEWKHKKNNKNGSEMYLCYIRN